MSTAAGTVVFAPDSFKGSIGAADAASALSAGWASVRPDDRVVLRPVADGGEGTLDAFAAAVAGATRMRVSVTGPDGTRTDASWLRLPPTEEAPAGTGVVELASTSGIELLGDQRLPWDADTTGFGQAIAAALDAGVSRLVLGIGSSASTDGGTGLLRALGATLTDRDSRPIGRGARGLSALMHADLTALQPPPTGGVIVLSDVTNPLLGPLGAATVFGPQKGFTPDDIAAVEDGLGRLAGLLPADPRTPGAGAAGGSGLALLAWGAQLVPGAGAVAELVGLRDALAAASVVVTGEGSFDRQSAAGKAPAHVAEVAGSLGVRIALAAGRIAANADLSAFAAAVSLIDISGSLDAARTEPARWLREAGAVLARSCG
ncbi:glycerate kinase [Agromyces laixinhei]|uniref:glycerate kinase n=1 Tax=Agromyces laixinhei TaxID=2585717 RepID=UPI001115B5BF|nr:glycerate kinase [Agromyces laixinhei]